MATVLRAVQSLRRATVRWRVPLTLAGAALFTVGLALSISALDLTLDQLAIWPIVLTLVLLAPLTLALAAVSLQQSAQVVGRRIGFREAFAVSAIGNISEILPIPGGAIVRGAALIRAGAALSESAWVVTLTAVLTLSMAMGVGSAPLFNVGSNAAFVFVGAGAIGTLVSAGWIAFRSGIGLTLAMVLVRILVLVIAVGRVVALFSAIGLTVSTIDAALFAVASTVGSAVSIVPAGLGISEGLGAALALFVSLSPASAFLVVALNRILGLCVSGMIAFVLTFARTVT